MWPMWSSDVWYPTSAHQKCPWNPKQSTWWQGLKKKVEYGTVGLVAAVKFVSRLVWKVKGKKKVGVNFKWLLDAPFYSPSSLTRRYISRLWLSQSRTRGTAESKIENHSNVLHSISPSFSPRVLVALFILDVYFIFLFYVSASFHPLYLLRCLLLSFIPSLPSQFAFFTFFLILYFLFYSLSTLPCFFFYVKWVFFSLRFTASHSPLIQNNT